MNNIEGTAQCTILKEDVNGFLFESNRGTKHTFIAETLGNDFNVGWSRKGKKIKSKTEALKQKLKNLAKEIYESYFHSNAQQQPRGTIAKLNSIVNSIEDSCNMQLRNDPNWKIELKNALNKLSQLLNDEHSISSYETYTSGKL